MFISRNSVFLILTMTLLSFAILVISIPLLQYLDSISPSRNIQDEYTKLEFLILAILVAPLVETFLFQFIVIEIMQKFVKAIFPIVALSAILFSLSHLNSYSYAMANLFNGLIFAGTYILASKKGFNSFLCTATVHSLRNLIVFIASIIFGL